MLMKSFLAKANGKMSLLISVLGVIYIVGIQLPLLSPYRHVIVDEFLIADSSYAMASGQTSVPAMGAWAHIIPEFGTINFHYTPAYLYLLAFTFQALGFSIVSVGLLHALLRLLSSGLFFLITRKNGHSKSGGVALTTVWATFCHGPVGRPEDLAILFVLASVALLLYGDQVGYKFLIAGACQGMAILTHPSAVITTVPLGVVVIWMKHTQEPKAALKKISLLITTMLAVSCTWLFWIIPYWHEFRVIFMGFVLPDSAMTSYSSGLFQFAREAVTGEWAWVFRFFPEDLPQFRYHYSLTPIALLLVYLAVRRLENRAFWTNIPIMLFSLAVIPILAAKNAYYGYIMSWFNVCLLVLIALMGTRKIATRDSLGKTYKSVYAFLLALIAIQIFGHAYGQAKQITSALIVKKLCNSHAHLSTLKAIPANEKVIINDGYVFYHIRGKNPIFWPSGLQGQTKSGVAFTANYDSSFRWMVLHRPLSEDKNPGSKFYWNSSSYQWFTENFTLQSISTIDKCYTGRLRGYTQVPKRLYVYSRKP